MYRILAHVITAALAGCATCRDVVALHPSVLAASMFEVPGRLPNGDDLFLDSGDVSLFLTPCAFEWAREPFTLCAMLMMPAGRSIRLTSGTADLLITASGEHRPLSLVGKGFDPTETLVGADRPPHGIQGLVDEPWKQQAKRRTWYFMLQRTPLTESATLTLPAFTINGRAASFPPILLAPATMHYCPQEPV